MSDVLRSFDLPGLLSLGLVCLAWAAGGWLCGRAWFALRPGERLLGGAAAGFVVFLTLVNLFTPFVGLVAGSFAAAGLLLAAGLLGAWRAHLRWADLRADLRDWPQVAVVALLALVFNAAQAGVSLFDEYLHLPMVSVMGAGSIPPRFYLNPDLGFAYHYGLQIFAAVLARLGSFFTWTAWDLARGLALALTAGLGWLWVRRATRRAAAGTLGALAFVFGGGTRWLLLLLPTALLAWVSSGVTLSATGADTGANLVAALSRPWPVEGGGAVAFPFAFHNGVFTPVFFILGSTGALPYLTIFLLFLLARPFPTLRNPGGLAVLALIFANLALSAEHFFAFLWLGVALAMLIAAIQARRAGRPMPRAELAGWGAILAVSALLSAVQGAFITETLRGVLLKLQGQAPEASNVYGFALRWPPAILSAHLGELSPFNPRQLLALIAEFGPVLLVAPLATRFAWRALRRGDWLTGGMGLSALGMILFTLFVEYGVDRSSTRFAATSAPIWLGLAFPLLWQSYQRGGGLRRAWLGTLYGLTLFGGLVMFAIQLAAIPAPVPAYFLDDLDAGMSRKYWNRLEAGALVFDTSPERAVAVFGRFTRANSSIYVPLPAWDTLKNTPTVSAVVAAGYRYAYVDDHAWDVFGPQIRATYQQACVTKIDELRDSTGKHFRMLMDISRCQP